MKNYVYLGFVLDRSGSMIQDNKIDEVRNGFNEVIKENKKNKEIKYDISITIFDNHIDHLYDGTIKKAPKLTKENFYARSMTSLYDAIGITVSRIKDAIKKMNKESRPEKILITVMTDGLENNSTEYTAETLKELIKKLQKKEWEFVFMGTTEEAAMSAEHVGFGHNKSVVYANSKVGSETAINLMSSTITDYSTGNFATTGYIGRNANEALSEINTRESIINKKKNKIKDKED